MEGFFDWIFVKNYISFSLKSLTKKRRRKYELRISRTRKYNFRQNNFDKTFHQNDYNNWPGLSIRKSYKGEFIPIWNSSNIFHFQFSVYFLTLLEFKFRDILKKEDILLKCKQNIDISWPIHMKKVNANLK